MLPRDARSWYLPEPGGRPLPRLPSEERGEKGEPEVGDSAKAMPSGPYFLGLPFFFLPKRSAPLLPPPPLPIVPMAWATPSGGGTGMPITPPTTPGKAAAGGEGDGVDAAE